MFWIDTGLKLPPSIQIKRVRLKCDINAGEVLVSLFFFFGSVRGKGKTIPNKFLRTLDKRALSGNSFSRLHNSKTSVISDEAEFLEAAFTVEKEAIKIAIDTTVAILCGHQLAILDLVDGCVWIRKNDG